MLGLFDQVRNSFQRLLARPGGGSLYLCSHAGLLGFFSLSLGLLSICPWLYALNVNALACF